MAERENLGMRGKDPLVRLSVVLNERLDDHVRAMAFEARKSRSAYVRELIASDARRHDSLRSR